MTTPERRPATDHTDLRRALWLHHGHADALYGDDGEMQCNVIPVPTDFLRDDMARIANHLRCALDAERSTRAELEAARARLQTALDQATRGREIAEAVITTLEGDKARWRERASASSARAEEATRALAEACSEACMAFCLYCGDAVEYRMADGPKAAHDRMLAHDATCAKNPHLARAQAAEAREGTLRAALTDLLRCHEGGGFVQPDAEVVAAAQAALAAPAGDLVGAVREVLAALDAAHEPLCGAVCPATWRTDDPRPHARTCEQARAAHARLAAALGEGT